MSGTIFYKRIVKVTSHLPSGPSFTHCTKAALALCHLGECLTVPSARNGWVVSLFSFRPPNFRIFSLV